MPNGRYGRHHEESIVVPARAEDVFAYLDDHANLAAHMSQSSWMMAGSRMDMTVDAARGQQVGSHIRMNGNMLGLSLYLDEVVTRREPPREKVWETVGTPRLLVIGSYRMGFSIEPREMRSSLRIFIDYDMPATNAWLGSLFGGTYAKWCVGLMLKGAAQHFAVPGAKPGLALAQG